MRTLIAATTMAATLAIAAPAHADTGGPEYASIAAYADVVTNEPLMVDYFNQKVPFALDLFEWGRLAMCEAGGDWAINTGNGYYGGLQANMQFWIGYGGLEFAPRPDLASIADQIEVGRRGYDARGWKPWPGCAHRYGWLK